MNPYRNRIIIISLSMLFLAINLKGQENKDSVSLQNVIAAIVNNNPQLKQAAEKVNGSIWKEELSKSSYMPSISLGANINKLYPLTAFDFTLPNPQTGEMVSKHFQMVPDVNMDYGLKVSQLIYDFGKTGDNLGMQQGATELSKMSIEQLKQRLSMMAAGYYFTLVYIQQAIVIKEDEVNTLKQHLTFVENKQKTGSATQYEILSTKVRISNTETQLSELQTSREIQLSHLNHLMDTVNGVSLVKEQIVTSKPELALDSLYNFAYLHRDEVLMAEKKSSLAEWNYKLAKAQNKPTLYFVGSTGFKNGYLPEINALKFNYMAGVSLNIPIFDSNRKHINMQIASSGIAESHFEVDNVKNQISDEVKENYTSLRLAEQKIKQYQTQLEQASEAHNHAETNYKAGALTNLDLLDASNALSESKLLLLKAQIDYQFYLIKFKSSIGERLY